MQSDESVKSVQQIVDALRWYVETLRESGVTSLPASPRSTAMSPPSLAKHEMSVVATQASVVVKVAANESIAKPVVAGAAPHKEEPRMSTGNVDLFARATLDKVTTLQELRAEIGDCKRCKLCQGRTHIVFGVGDPQAELMFVGEGPGRDEDLKGEPFVGRAGQLLTEIITKGMKMRREDVYIANVVKCRPPENRNPEPDEITACQPFLAKQVELVNPRIIVALGTFAAQTLLQSKTPISRLRGVWHSYQGVKLMPTLHPAYLLRNPNDKKLVWQDIQAVLREMGRL